MKKCICFALCLVMAISLCACAQTGAPAASTTAASEAATTPAEASSQSTLEAIKARGELIVGPLRALTPTTAPPSWALIST